MIILIKYVLSNRMEVIINYGNANFFGQAFCMTTVL